MQLAKRYVNAHALVDLSLSAIFDPPLGSGGSVSTKTVQEPCIIISTPTVIEKGTLLPLERFADVASLQVHSVGNTHTPPPPAMLCAASELDKLLRGYCGT